MIMRTPITLLLASTLLFAINCKGDDDDSESSENPATGAGTQVEVTVKEFSVSVDPAQVPAGDVTFSVTNTGYETHEFVVIKTDVAEDALPLKDGKVDSKADGLEVVDEVEGIEAGKTKRLSVSLDAGKHVLICNRQQDLPDGGSESHYHEGMHVAFDVE